MPFHARLLLFSAAAALLLAGCGPREQTGQKKRIAGIVFGEDQFFRLVLFGMRDAARTHGVELLEANSAQKPDREIQLVNTYIANNVDAIVISPLSTVSSVSALARARDKKITIVTFNTTITEDFPVSFVESDQTDLGASTGKAARAYIEKHLGGRAQVAILAFMSQAREVSTQRTDGFKKEISGLPGVRIVAEQDAWMPEQGVKKVGDILTANPGVNVIWAANEGGTTGAVMAVRNSGKAGKVVVFGTDTDEQLANFLLADDNILQAVTGQQPFEIGRLAVEAAVKTLKGEPIDKRRSLPGILLTRENPGEVNAFKERLAKLTQ
ncbi:MAG: sugar transporter substrate-binding protein [Bacteroidetes bacterium]|jgi:ABC-type sugar transport system substrate-binding protein|nr:sugar transporter substrate-binding protein [Bacteroidota bacterium]